MLHGLTLIGTKVAAKRMPVLQRFITNLLVVVNSLEATSYRDDFPAGHHGIAIQVLAEFADEAARVAFNALSGAAVEVNDLGATVIVLAVTELEQKVDHKRGNATLLAADGCMSSRFHFSISLYVRRSICSK